MKHYCYLLLLTLFFACGDASDGATATTEAEEEPKIITDKNGEIRVDTREDLPENPVPGRKYRGPDGKTHIVIEPTPFPVGEDTYEAAAGFNAAGSDERAVAIADSIVKYHGGMKAYNDIRYLSWNFFGSRKLLWDKHQKRVRIEFPKNNAIYLLEYGGEEPTGRVQIDGEEVTDPSRLEEELAKANSIFINDSYWLVHQFKLKDSGVTLKFIDTDEIDPEAKRPSHVIDMTFEAVGDTPQNRYRLYVDKVSYRINTWQFFRDAADTEVAMQTPWRGYVPQEGVLFSHDRGKFSLAPVVASQTQMGVRFNEF